MTAHTHKKHPSSIGMTKTTHMIEVPTRGQIPEDWRHPANAQISSATDELPHRRAQLQRRATRNLRPIAFHEAAHAVVARSFGYQVENVSTYPHVDVFDPLTGDVDDLVGCNRVVNLPNEEDLRRPDNRIEAERYIIMRLIGPFAEAFARVRRNRWDKSDDLQAVLPLIEHHAEWCQGRYFAWLKERTELTFFGPALTEILAVARKLVRQREMTGTEFSQFLRRRTRDEERRSREDHARTQETVAR